MYGFNVCMVSSSRFCQHHVRDRAMLAAVLPLVTLVFITPSFRSVRVYQIHFQMFKASESSSVSLAHGKAEKWSSHGTM